LSSEVYIQKNRRSVEKIVENVEKILCIMMGEAFLSGDILSTYAHALVDNNSS